MEYGFVRDLYITPLSIIYPCSYTLNFVRSRIFHRITDSSSAAVTKFSVGLCEVKQEQEY